MKKKLLMLMALMLVFSFVVGCSAATPTPTATTAATTKASGAAATTAAATTAATTKPAAAVTYPLVTKEKLTYWVELNSPNVSTNFTSLNDTEFAKYIKEETGVTIEYTSPAVGQGPTAFSLLVASGNMTDIVDYGWAKSGGYPGGPSAALNNKIIVPLNSLMEANAPDLLKVLKENPKHDKMVKTDEGKYYIFPVTKLDDYLNTTAGIVLRTDWLTDLKLAVPETIDDWYTVLKAFKTQKGAVAPLTLNGYATASTHFSYGMFVGAYGIAKTWYLNAGKIVYGANQPAYKDWLTTMAKWYAEGLLDNNFATNNQAATDSNILTFKSGATTLWLGSGLGKYIPALQKLDPKAMMGPAPYPVLKKGDVPQFNSLLNSFDGAGACITTSCKNPELAAKFLNYGYTEKGRKTYNYGREGISFTYDSNKVVNLTDVVTKNPLGWPIGQAWSKYSPGVYPGPYVSERRFLELYYPYPQQIEGLKLYTATNMREHLLPPISPTTAESSEFARLMTDIKAYEDEYTLTAIMGTVNVGTTFDAYLAQMKKLGIDKAIEIQTAALARYNAR
jgi:putative aldouronate transport system substrate-binding protein